jgi:putative ATP-dependent endonuclease of OLD family
MRLLKASVIGKHKGNENMHISTLRIRNFRNFLTAKFEFQKNVNTLVGENGSGKTNALYALRLLLDDSLARNANHLGESDFCRALGDWRGHWIVISIDFEELDSSEGCQIMRHQVGHMNETETGTYTLYFRPNLIVRTHLYEMGTAGVARTEIDQYLNTLTTDNYEPVITGRATADFLDGHTYDQLVGDFALMTFPNPNEEDQNFVGEKMQSIHPEISCTFAPALRDVISDLRGYRSNPLLTLLRGTEKTIKIDDAERITKIVTDLNNDISALPEIKRIAEGIQSTLQSTVGHTYSPGVGVQSTLPDQMDKLLQRLTVKVSDDLHSTQLGDLSEQGLGGANLIYLALKLLEYEVKLSSDRVAHFLLIEEPEAHIHTHIQKTLFENQPTLRTQVIVSTHSTHISSVARINSVNVLARRSDHAEVFQPANGLDSKAIERVERYLDAVRSTLLFAKGVILVEGQAELVLIPAMIKAVFGLSPDEMGISVIAMDCAFFEHVAVVFQEDRVQRRCAIVTDLDTSLLELPNDPVDDDKKLAHARASQEVGEARRELLSNFVANNGWVQAFLAKYTFEVEFVAAGNAPEVIRTLDDIYQNPKSKDAAKVALQSDDLTISGQEILRLAKKVGKGWLALLLSEQLNDQTFVPEYILRAVAFAAGGLSIDAIKRMGLFRIADNPFIPPFPAAAELQKLPADEFNNLYKQTIPDDQLSTFISYLEEYDVA